MKNILFIIFTLVFTQSTFAKDIEAGKAKSVICAACHGANGIAVIPGYPNLAGQNEQYIISSLKAYKEGLRTGSQALIMKPQSMLLSDTDMVNIAAYYASLK